MSAYDRPAPWRLTAEMVEAFMVTIKPKPKRPPEPDPPPVLEPAEKPARDRITEAFGPEPGDGDEEGIF